VGGDEGEVCNRLERKTGLTGRNVFLERKEKVKEL